MPISCTVPDVTVHPVTGQSDPTRDWTQDEKFRWIMTVGARTPGDPRDGELHGLLGDLPEHFDLEPWEEWEDQEDDVRYFRSDSPPIVDDEGRTVWIYEYRAPE